MKAILSPNTRIRFPEAFKVGDFSIVDDFSYFSTQVQIGRCTHIASNCTIGGGKGRLFKVGDFSSVSSGVRIWCTSDDFVNDLVVIPPVGAPEFKKGLCTGDVVLEDYTAVGTNTVILPKNHLPEGTVIGAMSLVPYAYGFEPWCVYAGNPIRKIKERNRTQVLEQVAVLEKYIRSLGAALG